ncbi:hypothetical protein ABEB36_012615 [Hypothenemus hampei]|uniref:Paired domain-containing protein n=1 Tax=Hypothenemus hampei TaxID=57062 RepID=A0ABD1EBV2_HYPHA
MGRGKAINAQLRQLIVKKYCTGRRIMQIANELGLSKSTVSDILKHYRETGSIAIKGKSTGRPRLVTNADQRKIVKVCKNGRKNTLRAVTALWNAESGLNIEKRSAPQRLYKKNSKISKARYDMRLHVSKGCGKISSSRWHHQCDKISGDSSKQSRSYHSRSISQPRFYLSAGWYGVPYGQINKKLVRAKQLKCVILTIKQS